jgi:hypothetical protein
MAKYTKTQLNALSVELADLLSQKKALEAREKELKTLFKSIGGFDGKSVLVSVSESNRNGVDLDTLRAKYPEVALECNRVTLVTTVSVKRKK